MSNIQIGTSKQAFLSATGAGTEADPYILAVSSSGGASVGAGFTIPATLTVTNGAYTIADVVGGLITLADAVSANGKRSIINTITLGGVVAIPYELWFLNADIAAGTIADNGAFAIAAADEAKVLGVVPISAIDYNAAQSSFNFATIRGIGLQVKAGASATSIYAYLKATVTTSPGTATLYLNVSGEWID
jgi:hypothetical protein